MAGHAHDLSAFAHEHRFTDGGLEARRCAVGWVAVLTLATMAIELVAGAWTGSLALTADGWHMGTHAFALGGAWAAYRLAQRAGPRCAFGGWKIEVLAAYTSGLGLFVVAVWIGIDGLRRLFEPAPVDYAAALLVALVGLGVNLASALVLMRGQGASQVHGPAPVHPHRRPQGHGQDHSRDQPHDDTRGHGAGHAHDHNYRAALVHVLADALTSVLAIVALAGGSWFGWRWLDPAVALVGAVVIARWSFGVLGGSARVLVDASAEPGLVQRIRAAIESDGDARVTDLHVWQVGTAAWCGAIAVVAGAPMPAAGYRARLLEIVELRHVTVEVHGCPGCGAG